MFRKPAQHEGGGNNQLACSLSIIILALLCPFSGKAAEIYWSEPISDRVVSAYVVETVGDPVQPGQPWPLHESKHLRIEGRLAPGDADVVEALLSRALPDINSDWYNNILVSLDSEGGDFATGLRLSDLFQQFSVTTYVASGDQCYSSCAIAFLGGSEVELRGFPPKPEHLLHISGEVGFHAPFTDIASSLWIAEGTPFNSEIGSQLADHFYQQAQHAINEITRRMNTWQLEPDFAFEMITKKVMSDESIPTRERFILIDTFERVLQTGSTLVVPLVAPPREIGLFDAYEACGFVLGVSPQDNSPFGNPFFLPTNLHDFSSSGPIGDVVVLHAPERSAVSLYPQLVNFTHNGFNTRHLTQSQDPDSFYLYGLSRSLGWYECSVFRHEDGNWYVQTFNQETHFYKPDGALWTNQNYSTTGYYKTFDLIKPYLLDDISRLGAKGSWEDYSLPEDDLSKTLTVQHSDVIGASFPCGDELDPAAEVICKFPELAVQDGILGKLYLQSYERDGVIIRQAQRDFIALRDRVCRTEKIDRQNINGVRNLARCLRHMTSLRNQELQQRQ